MDSTKKSLWSRDFILIVVINLFVFMSWQMLLPTLPLYAKSLGGSDALLGWLFGAPTIASLLIRPFSGILLDNIGRKAILIPGLFILMLVTFSFPCITAVMILVTIRFFHGVGWGLASTASSTIASDNIPKEKFGEGMGYFSLSGSLAMAIAPGIALAIFAAQGFKAVAISSTAMVFAVFFLSFFIRASATEEKKIKKSRAALYEKASIVPAFLMFLICSTYGAITGFLALYANDLGIKNIGAFFTVFAITLLMSRPALGKLTDKYGFAATLYPGIIFVLLTMIILYKVINIPAFLFAAFFYGLGLGATQASLQTMSIVRAPKDRLGAANATFFTGFDGGIGFGSVLGGIVAANIGYASMYLSFASFAIIAAIVYYCYRNNQNKPD